MGPLHLLSESHSSFYHPRASVQNFLFIGLLLQNTEHTSLAVASPCPHFPLTTVFGGKLIYPSKQHLCLVLILQNPQDGQQHLNKKKKLPIKMQASRKKTQVKTLQGRRKPSDKGRSSWGSCIHLWGKCRLHLEPQHFLVHLIFL